MIKLGIIVIYLVPEVNERLLELHLKQIEKHTQVPYTIFGCATRLSDRALAMLASNSNVSLCECGLLVLPAAMSTLITSISWPE